MYKEYDLCYKLTMRSDAVLNLRMPVLVKDALAQAADANLRSLSSMAVWAMAEWLADHGYLNREALAQDRPTSKRSRR